MQLIVNDQPLGILSKSLTMPVQVAVGIFREQTVVTYVPPVCVKLINRDVKQPSFAGKARWIVVHRTGAIVRQLPELGSDPLDYDFELSYDNTIWF